MNESWIIKPRFNSAINAIYFPTSSLNTLQDAEYNDNFGFYQRQFGVYSYMTMTHDFKYVIHYPEGSPFLWQSHNSCAWTPTGSLQMKQLEITPCKAKINESTCYDEKFNSTFKYFMQWGGNPAVSMTPQGIQMTNTLTNALVKNATLGARLTLECGQVYDFNDVTFAESTSSNITGLFKKTVGTCRGWIDLLRTKAAEDESMAHLDIENLINIDENQISENGKEYIGDPLALYDRNFAGAKTELKDAIIEGGAGGFGIMFNSLWKVSPSIYRSVDAKWKELKENNLQNDMRITREGFQVVDGGRSKTIWVYYIDSTVVIPISSISLYDRYLTGASHFCYLTISGTVQLGGSFGDLPKVNESEVAIMVQQRTDANNLGKVDFLSHALFATAVNDTNFIAGSYIYAEPSE